MTPRTYLRILLAIVLVTTALTFAMNWIVDPYGITHAASIEGVNRRKTQLAPSRFKPRELKCLEPRTVLLGTSRAHAGLDPNHPALPAVDGPVYNAAVDGSNIRGIFQQLVFAHAQKPLARAVIGLDFVSFSARFEDVPALDDVVFADMPGMAPSRALLLKVRMALSSKSTSDSVLTVARQRTHAMTCTNDGGFSGFVDTPVRGGARRASLATERVWLSTTYSSYALAVEPFAEIVRFARANGIALGLFVSPSHARHYEMLSLAGLWPAFEHWKRELVRILADDPAIPLWDFSGYNSVTSEEMPPLDDPTPMKQYRESVHYRKATGDLILDRVFGHVDPAGERVVPADFGVQLRSENLERHLEAVRKAQERYRRGHEAEYAELAGLVASVRRSGKPVGPLGDR